MCYLLGGAQKFTYATSEIQFDKDRALQAEFLSCEPNFYGFDGQDGRAVGGELLIPPIFHNHLNTHYRSVILIFLLLTRPHLRAGKQHVLDDLRVGSPFQNQPCHLRLC